MFAELPPQGGENACCKGESHSDASGGVGARFLLESWLLKCSRFRLGRSGD